LLNQIEDVLPSTRFTVGPSDSDLVSVYYFHGLLMKQSNLSLMLILLVSNQQPIENSAL
jgi:hypothetical protein